MNNSMRYREDDALVHHDVKGKDGAVYTTNRKLPRPVHDHYEVGTSSEIVVEENADRKYLLLVNDSESVIYLAINVFAKLNWGIRLNPNGGSYEMSIPNGNLTTERIQAIAETNDNRLMITEA